MPGVTRKDREYRTRRSEIMTAAERVFSSKGFHKATMSDIARKAEFAEGTLYKFFKGKIDLYYSIVEEKGDELLTCLREQVSSTGGAVERIKSLINAEMAFFERNRHFFKIFMRESSGFEKMDRKHLSGKVNKVYENYINFVSRIIKDGLRQKEFRNLEPREASYALMGLVNSSIHQWITTSGRERLIERAPLLTGIFLKGVQK